MALVSVSFTAYYKCRGPDGRFLPTQQIDLTVDAEESVSGDYSDAMWAEAAANAPDGCVDTAVSQPTVTPYADAGVQETPPGVETSVRALVWFSCTYEDGEVESHPLEYAQNFPGDTQFQD